MVEDNICPQYLQKSVHLSSSCPSVYIRSHFLQYYTVSSSLPLYVSNCQIAEMCLFCIFCNEMRCAALFADQRARPVETGQRVFPSYQDDTNNDYYDYYRHIYIGNSFFVCHTLMTVVANKYRRKWILMERPTVLGLICREV